MVTKGYGITVNDIDQSCPADLIPYEKAYKMLANMRDIENWQLGQYISASISSAFSKKTKYPKKPMFQIEDDAKENGYKESKEEVAVFEMKQRIELLRQKGLPESPM